MWGQTGLSLLGLAVGAPLRPGGVEGDLRVTASLSAPQLEVNNNTISGGLDVLVAKCPSLSYLNLCGNKIKDLASLEALVRPPPPPARPPPEPL